MPKARPTLSSKLPEVGTTIFSTMTALAQRHTALNLSQGFPEFSVAEDLIAAAHRHMLSGKNQYAPMEGLPLLRERIASMTQQAIGTLPEPDAEVTVTSGATEAIFASIMALVGAGDEVILFDPAYDSYAPAIRLSGACPIHLKLRQPDFSIDWEAVEGAITPRTRMIIINSPHNPTGTVLSEEDIRALEKLVEVHGVYILSDEVYAHITFDGAAHHSIWQSPLLRTVGIAVFSFGKTFHITGWKVGYTLASPALTREIRKVHQYLTFSVSTPMQYAIADHLKGPEHYMSLSSFYQKKRDCFLEAIAGSRFRAIPAKGTYFQLLSYAEWEHRPTGGDVAFARYLTKEHGLATIPISVFYNDRQDDSLLRVCFAKEEEVLTQAGKIICKI